MRPRGTLQIKRIIKNGITSGIIAGLVFAAAEMIINGLLGKPFLGPLRMISSIALGVKALEPTYPILNAVIAGVGVHMILSSLYGVIFLGLLSLFRQSKAPINILLLYSSIFGVILWIINFNIFAPIFWPQFTKVNQLWNGFAAHTFFYGTIIGVYISSIKDRES